MRALVEQIALTIWAVILAMLAIPAAAAWLTFGSPWLVAYEHWRKGQIGAALMFATIGSWPFWLVTWFVFFYSGR